MGALGVAVAHGVRMGLEDNLYQDEDRQILATNASLVERVHRLAIALERPLETPRTLRERLGLSARQAS